MNFLLAWAVSFIYIYLKATQQRHVQFAEYWRMPPMSYGMAACEVFTFTLVIRHYDDIWSLAILAFCIGTGAWMGSVLGTWLHVQSRRKRR